MVFAYLREVRFPSICLGTLVIASYVPIAQIA